MIDEDQEIEFKETFFTATRSHDGNDINRDVIKKAAIKEITGFLNSNDGTLLIGVADGKNTETKKPEARGIENDYLKSNDDDKYCRDINQQIKNSLGLAAASLVKITIEIIDGKKICRINCEKSSEPVYCNFKGKAETSVKDIAYVRTGADTEKPQTDKAWHDWLKKYFPESLKN